MELTLDLIILTRLIAATILGAAIGLERELTNKYAGLRTHILVCLGSCIFTILSIYAFPLAADNMHPQAFGDPARIAAQVLTGIGFIGGGTVLRHGSSVYGLTTAATLWLSASIGMACGAGMVALAFISTLLCVIILVLIRAFERKFLSQSIKNHSQLKIITICDNNEADNIYKNIIDNVSFIQQISKEKINNNSNTQITAIVNTSVKHNINSLYEDLNKINGIEKLLIQDNNE